MNGKAFPNPDAIETLQLELSLLQVLHHRNKNQHHLQPFFKQLSILKRSLSTLLEHPDYEYLVQKVRNVIIPAAWEEFSRVIARGEFVNLGMVLCASTARISYFLGGAAEIARSGLMEETDDLGEAMDTDELGETMLREILGEEETDVPSSEGYTEPEPVTPSQLTSRLPVEMQQVPQQSTSPIPPRSTALNAEDQHLGEIQPPRKRQKRKKKQDEIDRLFAGLE